MSKTVPITELLRFLGDEVISVQGNPDQVFINNLRASELIDENSLDWVNPIRKDNQTIAENSKARVILCGIGVTYTEKMASQGKVLIVVQNPKLALLKIGNHFFVETTTPEVHKTAVIHPQAFIGKSFYAGANVTVGRCRIGDHVKLYPNVVVHDGVVIGNHVTVKPGAVLGFDGFGYERDENRNWVKFPQIGGLIIHDHVEIGSGCCIDRGSLSDTIIGFNTKINNLCRIAHNVVIGGNVIIAGQVSISGSTTIEDDVWIAPGACFRGHQTIGRGATIGLGAVVLKDVPPGETWVGNPARKLEK